MSYIYKQNNYLTKLCKDIFGSVLDKCFIKLYDTSLEKDIDILDSLNLDNKNNIDLLYFLFKSGSDLSFDTSAEILLIFINGKKVSIYAKEFLLIREYKNNNLNLI